MSDHIDNPKVVLQLIDGFATEEHSGGAAQFGIQLARHLDRRRYTPVVCGLWRYNTSSEARWRKQLQAEGIPTMILIEQPTRLAADIVKAAALLALLVDRIKPRIINSHFERGDLLALWSKLYHAGQLCITRTMHTDQQWQTRPWLGQLLNIAAFPWLFDEEIAISEATRQALDSRVAARVRGRRSVLLYNGVSGALLDQLSARREVVSQSAHREARVAIIGRLEPQKGVTHFLQACFDVHQRHPTAEFWVVGAGHLMDELRATAAALGLAHAVRFLGQRSDVADILLQTDLLVSASLWEGFPTVLLEAMAAQVPIVATDVSGSRELVRDRETGLLVPPAQPAALAEAMNWALEHHDAMRRMAFNAYQQVQHYTLEHTAHGYEQLYAGLTA